MKVWRGTECFFSLGALIWVGLKGVKQRGRIRMCLPVHVWPDRQPYCGADAKRRDKTINKTFCGRKWPVWDPLFPESPRKSLCGSLLCVLSQKMRHINFFSGGPKWGVLGGGQKVYVEKAHVLFRSPKCDIPSSLKDDQIARDNRLPLHCGR